MHRYRLIINLGFIICCLLPSFVFAQDAEVIKLRNPSFEDFPKAGTENGRAPKSWYDCGKPGETAPDIHPGPPPKYHFAVNTPPNDGNTYLGLVARSNDTYEAVAQRLSKPMERGKAYTFGLHLAQSPTYLSPVSRESKELSNYDTPIKIRVWGGNGYCKKDELLDESPLVNHADWRQYQFKMEPKSNHTFILIEAFWKTPILKSYRGNILIDNATPIYVVPIDELEKPLPSPESSPIVKILSPAYHTVFKSEDNTTTVTANIEHIKNKEGVLFSVNGKRSAFKYDPAKGFFRAKIPMNVGENKIRIKVTNPQGTSQDEVTAVYAPKVTTTPKPDPVVTTPKPPVKNNYVLNPELNNKPKIGQRIRIEKLHFKADSSSITPAAFPALDELAEYLKSNREVRIEVGGHTNNRCQDSYCNSLSESRAKAVANYLRSKGIAGSRITHKGYGKNEPIASNKYDFGRRRNQRVEIKIL